MKKKRIATFAKKYLILPSKNNYFIVFPVITTPYKEAVITGVFEIFSNVLFVISTFFWFGDMKTPPPLGFVK
jgi:hypothetical protein